MLYSKEPPARKSSKMKRIVIIGAAIVGLCIVIAGVLMIQAAQTLSTDSPAIQQVTDEFMRAAASKDVDAAYQIFAEEARAQFPIADVEKLITDMPVLFDNYQSISMTKFNVESETTLKSTRTSAQVAGTVTYSDGTGTFEAQLLKVNDRWQLVHIQVNVDPEKLKVWKEEQKKALPVKTPAVRQVIDEFMRAGATKNVDGLSTLYAEAFHQGNKRSYIEDMLSARPFLFENYESADITQLKITPAGATNTGHAQAKVTADLVYGDGDGELTVELIEEGGTWKITMFKISVNESKAKAWFSKHLE